MSCSFGSLGLCPFGRLSHSRIIGWMINVETMRFKCCFEVVSTCFIYAENWNGDVFPRVTASPVNFHFFFGLTENQRDLPFCRHVTVDLYVGNLDTVNAVYPFIQSTELIFLLVALVNCWSSRVPISIAWSSCTSELQLINRLRFATLNAMWILYTVAISVPNMYLKYFTVAFHEA